MHSTCLKKLTEEVIWLWTFEKKISKCCEHFILRVQRISLRDELWIGEFFFKIITGLWEGNFQSSRILLIGRAFKIAISLPDELCDKEQFLRGKEITLRKFLASEREFFRIFGNEAKQGYQICILRVRKKFLRKNIFFHKNSYFLESISSFRTLLEKIPELRSTLFFSAIKKASWVSGGSLWRKTKVFRGRYLFIIVFGVGSEKFALSKRNNWLGCKNSFLCVQGNFLRERFDINKSFNFKCVFGLWVKNFQSFGVLLIGRAFKIATYVSRGNCDEKQIFWEKDIFLKMIPDFDWKSLHSRKKIGVSVKTLFYVSRGTFSEKILNQKVPLLWKFFGPREKFFRTVGKIASRKVVIIPFYVCRGTYQGNKNFRKRSFPLFPGFEQKLDL